MTANAQAGDFGEFGDMRSRIVGMFRQRAVASFAGYVGVFAGGTLLAFVVVTKNACILSGECDRMLPNQVQRAGTVVSILSKSFGYDRAADDEEDPKAGENDQGRSD